MFQPELCNTPRDYGMCTTEKQLILETITTFLLPKLKNKLSSLKKGSILTR